MNHLHRMIEMDEARIRAVDQAAFKLGFWLGAISSAGFVAFVAAVIVGLR